MQPGQLADMANRQQTKQGFDMGDLFGAMFGGGGHAMAAGARIKGTAEEVRAKFLGALEAELVKLG